MRASSANFFKEVMPVQVRYDEQKQIYRDCRFCGGKGCLACAREAEKAYTKEFPDGPKPIATFKLDSPKDMAIAKKAFGKDALQSAFGPEGGGVSELLKNLADAQD